MVKLNDVILSMLGIIAPIVTGFASWFFTRRKFENEVNKGKIDNVESTLDFYIVMVKDINSKLNDYIRIAEDSNREIYRLKEIVVKVLDNGCLDKTCTKRVFYSEAQIKSILSNVYNGGEYNKEKSNETEG